MTSSSDPALPVTLQSFRLLDISLDCIREIFLHVGPEDLLRLVRLCKGTRAFLNHRSSRGIWKQTFINLGGDLPACPPDLNEIQYANLAFSEHCHYCVRNLYLQADWDLRVRCCSEYELLHMTVYDSDHSPRLSCDSSVEIRKLIVIRPPRPFLPMKSVSRFNPTPS
ncbi:hypothetical protein B0H13DRAFT_2183761, partial [Mycena leptocephala]